ncbi:unnamed protein product [Closterium sp. NIES-64]|nr:unnamed protein product [Closterium sp. NIES-64]
MEECAQCGERAVDYDDQALALVCARCGHVADEAQLTSRVEFDELGRAGGVRVGGGGGGGDGGEPRSWMWTAGAGGGRFGGGGWREGAETKWGGGGKSAEFKRRKNKREWEERLGAVVAGLRVPEGVRGDAVGVAERVLEGRWGSGQWMNVLMAAAVYIAARNRRLPVSMGEVAVSAVGEHATDCELAAVWAMFKRIMTYFPMLQPEQVDLVSHVWRAVHAMPALREWQGEGGRQALVGDAMRLLTFAHSLSLHTGRHAAPVPPLAHAAPIAAAALLLVAGARGVVLGEAELCAAMAVPPATVRQRFSELTRALTRLARSLLLPGAHHVASQAAFHRLLPSILAVCLLYESRRACFGGASEAFHRLLPSILSVRLPRLYGSRRTASPCALSHHTSPPSQLLPSPSRVGHRFVMPSADVDRHADVADQAADVATPSVESPGGERGAAEQVGKAGGVKIRGGTGEGEGPGGEQGEQGEERGDRGGEEGEEGALEAGEGRCFNELLPPAFEDSVLAHQRRTGVLSRARHRLQHTKRDRWGCAATGGAGGGLAEGAAGERSKGGGEGGEEGRGVERGCDGSRMEVLWRWEGVCVDDKGGGGGGKRAKRSMRCFDEGGGGEAKARQGQESGSEEAVVDWLLLQQVGWFTASMHDC